MPVSKKWTIQQDTIVKELYGTMPAKEIALRVNRTAEAVRIRAKTLGINGDRPERWTKKEQALMIEKYEELGPTEMHTLIPNKSIAAIQGKAKLMNLKCRETKSWTREEEAFMLEHYISTPNKLIQDYLDRSENSVQRKAEEMGLANTKEPSEFEVYIESLLESIGVEYETQVKVGNFICDFIVDKTKVIETYGDYWHCNPDVYLNGPKYSIQKDCIERDKRRASYLKEMGYQLLTIWEKDALLNKKKVQEDITSFLNLDSKVESTSVYYWSLNNTKDFLLYKLYIIIKAYCNDSLLTINARPYAGGRIDILVDNYAFLLKNRDVTLNSYEQETGNIKPSKLKRVSNFNNKVAILKALGYEVIEVPVQDLCLTPFKIEELISSILTT